MISSIVTHEENLARDSQDEAIHQPQCRPTVFQARAQRLFGRSIDNIQLPKHEVINKAPSATSSWDIEEEYKPHHPLDSFCTLKDTLESMLPRNIKVSPTKEYSKEIDDHLFNIEQPNFSSLLGTKITDKIRAILIDWILEVHLKFKLRDETLFLTISILDKYLGTASIPIEKLQLLGATCMFIACKYEEIYPPRIKNFIYLIANSHTKDELLLMEQAILKQLNFNICIPSSYLFLKRFMNSTNDNIKFFSQYLLELALFDRQLLQHKPSLLAASSLYIANEVIGGEYWSYEMEKKTKCNKSSLEAVVKHILKLLQAFTNSKLKIIKRKFSLVQYGRVATKQEKYLKVAFSLHNLS